MSGLGKFRQRLKLSGLSITGVSPPEGASVIARARPWGDRRKLPPPPRSARGRQLSGALLLPPPEGRFQLGGAFSNRDARGCRANRARRAHSPETAVAPPEGASCLVRCCRRRQVRFPFETGVSDRRRATKNVYLTFSMIRHARAMTSFYF